MNQRVVGAIDIGSTRVRSVLAIKDEEDKVQVIGYAQEFCQIMSQGQIINKELAAKAILIAVEKAELMAGREVDGFYINLPSSICQGIYSNGIIAVEKDREVDIYDVNRVMEISQSVSLASDRSIVHNIPLSFNIDGIQVEEPVGASGVRLEASVYLIDCLKNCQENFRKIVERNGYQVEDFINENIAAAEVVLTPQEKKNGGVVIDIGYKKTSIAYYNNHSVAYIGHIKLGGYHVTKDLSYGLKTGEDAAEEIKIKHGVALEAGITDNEVIDFKLLSYQKMAKVSKKVVSRIIEARMEEIFSLAKKNLESAENFRGLNNVVVLTGGGALIRNADDLASKVFNDPCRIGTPLNFTGLGDLINSPSYATVLGLIQFAMMGKMSEQSQSTLTVNEKISMSKVKKYLKKFFT